MNERIRELAEQAGIDMWINGNDEVELPENQKKFAELIVKECAVVAHNTAEGQTTYGWMVGNKIKQHFGVEE